DIAAGIAEKNAKEREYGLARDLGQLRRCQDVADCGTDEAIDLGQPLSGGVRTAPVAAELDACRTFQRNAEPVAESLDVRRQRRRRLSVPLRVGQVVLQ